MCYHVTRIVYFLLYLHSVYCALVGLYLSLVILQQLFDRATVKLQHLHLVLQFMFLPRWYRENQNINEAISYMH